MIYKTDPNKVILLIAIYFQRTKINSKIFGQGVIMTMQTEKSCPKCNGDVFVEKDISGWYERCLQCGYDRDLKDVLEVQVKSSHRKKEPALR